MKLLRLIWRSFARFRCKIVRLLRGTINGKFYAKASNRGCATSTPKRTSDLPPRPFYLLLCERERAIKLYGLAVSKTLRKDRRDSLGLSPNLKYRGLDLLYGHCHYITFPKGKHHSLRPSRLSRLSCSESDRRWRTKPA